MTRMAFPFRIDGRGKTALADEDQHIKNLIEQVLLTAPGERVNRPTFGSGLNQLVFAPNSVELASATQFLVQGALQQWLGDVIKVEAVNIENRESTLHVTVQYQTKLSRQHKVAELSMEV